VVGRQTYFTSLALRTHPYDIMNEYLVYQDRLYLYYQIEFGPLSFVSTTVPLEASSGLRPKLSLRSRQAGIAK